MTAEATSTFRTKLARARRIITHPSNSGRRAQQLAIGVRAQVSNRLQRRPLAVPFAQHSKVLADTDFAGSMLAAYFALPDLAEMRVWQKHLGAGDVFVDVGANVGLYSVIAAEQGATVVAFEANARAAQAFQANMTLNGWTAELHQVAASNSVGFTSFSTDRDTMNGIVLNADAQAELVPTQTLDSLIGSRRVAGMKVDVEGAERLVLEGATGILERGVGLLQMEWNERSVACLGEDRRPVADLLRSYGYEFFRASEDGTLIETSDLGFGDDLFALRPPSQHRPSGQGR